MNVRRRSPPDNKPSDILHAHLLARPLPALTVFFQVQKKLLLQENPHTSHATVLQDLKLEWRTLSDQERGVFLEQAAAEKVRFAHQLLHWNREQDEFLVRKREARRSARRGQETDAAAAAAATSNST